VSITPRVITAKQASDACLTHTMPSTCASDDRDKARNTLAMHTTVTQHAIQDRPMPVVQCRRQALMKRKLQHLPQKGTQQVKGIRASAHLKQACAISGTAYLASSDVMHGSAMEPQANQLHSCSALLEDLPGPEPLKPWSNMQCNMYWQHPRCSASAHTHMTIWCTLHHDPKCTRVRARGSPVCSSPQHTNKPSCQMLQDSALNALAVESTARPASLAAESTVESTARLHVPKRWDNNTGMLILNHATTDQC